jgi:predicted Zn-dependent peptidase
MDTADEFTRLENGVRIVTDWMPEVRSVALGILLDAGPRDETPRQRGLAHLSEHLVFQGTSSRSADQIAQLMDTGGGSFGGFTARDYTCFSASVLDDYLTYALDLFGDIMLNSTFPAEAVEREKDAILREIALVDDVPQERVHARLKALAWGGHALGVPIAGLAETVSGLSRDDVIYFVHSHYLPDRMIVAAAGNVDHAEFVAQARDAFWRMLGQAGPAPAPAVPFTPGFTLESAPVSQAYFALGLDARPYTDPDRYALHLLSTLLGGGVSSRLFRRLRLERGLVYDIRADYHAYRQAGMLVIEGSTTPDLLPAVVELVLTELRNLALADEPFDAEELWKAKMQVRGQHLIASENSDTRMSRLATQVLYFGRRIDSPAVLAEVAAVDDQAMRAVCRGVLAASLPRAALAVVAPHGSAQISVPSMDGLLAGLR